MNIFETEIFDYGYDGEGVGKTDGKICFVPFCLKGEKVKFKASKENSSLIKGELVQVCKSSDKRQVAPCPYFERCGGCAYQHTSYENELDIKKEILSKQLKKIGYNGEIEVIKSDNEYGYRNKIKLFCKGITIGLKKKGSDQVFDIEKCLIAKDEINKFLVKIREFVSAKNYFACFSEIVVRAFDKVILINFVRKNGQKVDYSTLFDDNVGIFETFGFNTKHIFGLKAIDLEEFGLKFSLKINSFHQVNDGIQSKLYSEILNHVEGDRVLNCYSGAGVLSGIIASKGKKVVGIEIGKSEHEDAERLKEQNNLQTLLNVLGDCKDAVDDFASFDTIIVDPPKKGMEREICEKLNKKSFQRFVYVSCNSATLVRDLGLFENLKIKKAYLFDMFSRTGEYETLIIADKKI
jgi:23S rRNA (uracil1939-C5)-methyltransferase